MRRSIPVQLVAFAAAVIALTACGTTVGDPCTTPSDCADKLCINRGETPGGYCSQQCIVGDDTSCPSGTRCIPEGAGRDVPACYLECGSDRDCRTGYVCRRIKDQAFTVCVGPEQT